MACVAYPEQAMYAIPAIDKEFPVYYLPMGKENPNGDIKFSVRTEGDHTYIEYQADDPTKPAVNGPHNYDIEKLPMETIPEVPADSHVYITGNGQFPLKASLAYSYCGRCKSINMRPQGEQLLPALPASARSARWATRQNNAILEPASAWKLAPVSRFSRARRLRERASCGILKG